jgi:hypothetical protein
MPSITMKRPAPFPGCGALPPPQPILPFNIAAMLVCGCFFFRSIAFSGYGGLELSGVLLAGNSLPAMLFSCSRMCPKLKRRERLSALSAMSSAFCEQ